MSSCRISIYQAQKLVQTFTLDQTVVVGRRDPSRSDPPPADINRRGGELRLVIADQHIQAIPRSWFKIVLTDQGTFILKNIHRSMRLSLRHDGALAVEEERQFEHEVTIDLGQEIVIRIQPSGDSAAEADVYRSLESLPPIPGQETAFTTKVIREFPEPEANGFVQMLRLALQVVQKAAGSDAFFQSAVAATTEIGGLDRTILLLRSDFPGAVQNAMECTLPDGWCVVADHANLQRGTSGSRTISTTLLSKVVEAGRTVVHDPLKATSTANRDVNDPAIPSLRNVECAVASPILDHRREVIGVLYGDRRSGESESSGNSISDVEATLVEILAGAVAGGIARRAEERLRSRLSEFFSPKVTNLLATNPGLMEGQDAEVSVLFCDIRGFSTVTEKLGPQKSIEWINDVMSELSQCVIDRDGVLVDYVGDELLAMWGAPGEQLDHASRAIDAARAMLRATETLRSRWNDLLPQKFGAGIGVNTGPARVGNVGSRQKFKYGALGNTVNVGSRLQSATKQLGVACIAGSRTVQSAACLDDCRRLAKLTVVGIEEPIDVYEIVAESTNAWKELRESYQRALSDFENQRFREAASMAGAILPQYPEDGPSRKLLARAVAELDQPSQAFSAVWQLTSK